MPPYLYSISKINYFQTYLQKKKKKSNKYKIRVHFDSFISSKLVKVVIINIVNF